MPAALTYAAVWAFAEACSGLGAAAPLEFIAGYAMEESGGRQDAWNVNPATPTRPISYDCGLGQINSTNWTQLGLNAQSCKDPCRNMTALATLMKWRSLLASGSETAAFTIAHPAGGSYVAHMTQVSDRYRRAAGGPSLAAPPPAAPPHPRRRQQLVVLSSK